jgi:hypothetical protein
MVESVGHSDKYAKDGTGFQILGGIFCRENLEFCITLQCCIDAKVMNHEFAQLILDTMFMSLSSRYNVREHICSSWSA